MCACLLLVVGASWAATSPDTGDTGEAAPTTAPTETGDTGVTDPALELDQDADGWTPNDGDCDDAEPLASPGLIEVCFDQIDNDCDGLYDQGCDQSVRLASLQGGGGCTGGSNVAGTQAGLLLPLWWLTRRRSRSRTAC